MMGLKRMVVFWVPLLLLSYNGLYLVVNAHEVDSCAGICQIHGVHIMFEEEEKGKGRKIERPASRRRVQKSEDQSSLRRTKEDTWMFSCRTLWDENLDGEKYLPMHEIEVPVSMVANYGEDSLEDGEWSLCYSQQSQLLQGETSFIPHSAFNQDATGLTMISTKSVLEWGHSKHLVYAGNFRHLDTSSPRHLSQRTGTMSVLVVRLKTSQGQAPASSKSEMKKAIFGPTPIAEQAQGHASVAFQYSQMSHGRLKLEPAKLPNRGINDGIMELEFNNFGGRGMQFLARDLVKATEEALNLHQSTQLEDVVDHTIFCLPDDIEPPRLGTSTTWTAFTYVFDPFSFYRLDRCTRLSVVAHELGHAVLGFRHSGAYVVPETASDNGERVTINGVEYIAEEYGDETGYLGWSYNELGKPRKAFNAHKHWLSGWYSTYSMLTINPLAEGPRVVELVGYTAYQLSDFQRPNKNKAVLMKIGNLYLQYNFVSRSPFDDKWNNDTAHPNQVTIVKAEKDEAVSFLVSSLSPGLFYEEANFMNSGKSVMIRLCPLASDDDDDSSVVIQSFVKQGQNQVPPSCEIAAPTDPTPSPVRVQRVSPSFTPTLSPVNAPINDDLFTSSPGTGFDREGIVEEEKPEESSETFMDSNFPYLVGGLALILFSLMTLLFVLLCCKFKKKVDSKSNPKSTSPPLRGALSDLTEEPRLNDKIKRSYSKQKMGLNYPKGKRPRGPTYDIGKATEEGSDSATIPESIEISLEASIEQSPVKVSKNWTPIISKSKLRKDDNSHQPQMRDNVEKSRASSIRRNGRTIPKPVANNISPPIETTLQNGGRKTSKGHEKPPVSKGSPTTHTSIVDDKTHKRGNHRESQDKSPTRSRPPTMVGERALPDRTRKVSTTRLSDRNSNSTSRTPYVQSTNDRKVPTPRRSLSPQEGKQRRVPSRQRSLSPQKTSARTSSSSHCKTQKTSTERHTPARPSTRIEHRIPPRRPSPPPGTSARWMAPEDGPTTNLSATLEAHRSLKIKNGRRVHSGENLKATSSIIRMDQRSESGLVTPRKGTKHRPDGFMILKDEDNEIV